MAGENSSTLDQNQCYYYAKQCSSQITCDGELLSSFDRSMKQKMWRVEALLLASAILAGVIVGIGVFGQRYRYRRSTRFIFLGATTLFMPVMSTLVPLMAGSNNYFIVRYETALDENGASRRLAAACQPGIQSFMVIIWASLVQIITINTSAIVAVDDREGRNIGPPYELLVQGTWTFYLGITYYTNGVWGGVIRDFSKLELVGLAIVIGSEAIPFALICAKMVFKYYAFLEARQSFALGNNPHLVFRYMQQQPALQPGTSYRRAEAAVTEDADAPPLPPPPLLVMGEEKRHMEKQSHGYVWKRERDSSGTVNGVVTIDSVWKMGSIFPVLATLLQRQQDLCLSFAFFKLLRCRFARYNVNDAAASGDMFTFFWSLLLKDGGHNRVFQVISDEISFVHDYYYSSIPISYSKHWLPISGIFISLFSIAYWIYVAMLFGGLLVFYKTSPQGPVPQFTCTIICTGSLLQTKEAQRTYGSWLFGLVPLSLLLLLVLIVEARDIVSYVCSNWTKVALMCRLASSSSKHSLCTQKCAGLLLRCRCKLLKTHWDEKIGQCSVLVLQPRATPLGLLSWNLFPFLLDQKRKVRVPAAVKLCIIQVLRRTRNGQLSNGAACLRRRGQVVCENFLWACSNESTSSTILTWHIATSILEVRYPHLHDQEQGSSPISNTDDKIVATHLSRYCAYLVTRSPELLPDDSEWSRSMYEDVKKDAQRVLAGFTAGDTLTPEAKCKKLMELLDANAKHEVLINGVRLGKQLVELVLQGDDTEWKLLAEFWSEMILYYALSDNLKGHKEAIARGGELITLLWVLLFHAGIVSRPGEDNGAATSAAGVV